MKSWRQVVLLWIAVVHFLLLNGQSRWDGEAGDGNWNNPLNWNNNILPTITSDVILNHELFSGDYVVELPAGDLSVSIKSLTIHPEVGTIALIIPSTNTASPALTIAGPGYGLLLESGGIFRNSSGAGAGNTVVVTDSIRINNGGRYIHNTARTHTNVVQILSASPGTEEGIFEFDIPLASTTVGLSDRVFGKLVFASPVGPMINYTASGINALNIRSDLELKSGVRLSLNLDDTVFIARNLLLGNSILNISSGARNTVVNVRGDIRQESSGIITQTGTGLAELRLNGSAVQQLDIRGSIQNAVSLTVESQGEVQLNSQLTLPHRLVLVEGVVHSFIDRLLILGSACALQADKVSHNSFVDGPIKKIGLATAEKYLFPVGKGGQLRWLELRNATGNFLVEYHKSDPRSLSSLVTTPLDHISSLEYWSVTTDPSVGGTASVELSFNDPNSGGVTDLNDLRVARLQSGSWQNGGNTGATGTAGAAGSVLGEPMMFAAGNTHYLTLSSVSVQNPLPVRYLNLRLSLKPETVQLDWTVPGDNEFLYYLVQGSPDGRNFEFLSTLAGIKAKTSYDIEFAKSYRMPVARVVPKYFRVLAVNRDSSVYNSQIVFAGFEDRFKISISNNSRQGSKIVMIDAIKDTQVEIRIFDLVGRLIETRKHSVYRGRNFFPVNENARHKGVSIVNVLTDEYSKSFQILF